MFDVMTAAVSNEVGKQVGDSLEPFAQLFRAMLPRAANIAVFSGAGLMRWSSDATMGPDLRSRLDALLPVANNPAAGDGTLEMLGGQPCYLFWIRADDGALMAVVAVTTRPTANESEPRSFSFAHSLLRPALSCLRRELLAAHAIEDLTSSVVELDEDLELLLADAADANMAPDGSDELKNLLQRMVGHLGRVPVVQSELSPQVHGGRADRSGEGHRAGARRHRFQGRRAADRTRPSAAAADRQCQYPSGDPQ